MKVATFRRNAIIALFSIFTIFAISVVFSFSFINKEILAGYNSGNYEIIVKLSDNVSHERLVDFNDKIADKVSPEPMI